MFDNIALMDKQLLALVGLSLLVVLAGCNGSTGPASPTNTPSESPPQTETPENRSEIDGVELPGWATVTNINEIQALTLHQSTLANKDYKIGVNLTHARPGSSVNTTTIISSNISTAQLHLQSDLPGRTVQQYDTANHSLSQTVIGDNTTVDVSNNTKTFEQTHASEARPGELLTSLLTASNFTAVNTTTIDGHDAVVYNVTNVSGADSTRLPSTIYQFNGSMTVDERGIIWEASLMTVGDQNGSTTALIQEYRTLKYGNVSVEKPAWVQNHTQGLLQ
jgi:hypothetical protein